MQLVVCISPVVLKEIKAYRNGFRVTELTALLSFTHKFPALAVFKTLNIWNVLRHRKWECKWRAIKNSFARSEATRLPFAIRWKKVSLSSCIWALLCTCIFWFQHFLASVQTLQTCIICFLAIFTVPYKQNVLNHLTMRVLNRSSLMLQTSYAGYVKIQEFLLKTWKC